MALEAQPHTFDTTHLFHLIGRLGEKAPTVARGLEERALKLSESADLGFWKAAESLEKMETELEGLV